MSREPFSVIGHICGSGHCSPLFREDRHPPSVDELIEAYREGARLLRVAGKKRSAAILEELAAFEAEEDAGT